MRGVPCQMLKKNVTRVVIDMMSLQREICEKRPFARRKRVFQKSFEKLLKCLRKLTSVF